MKETKKQGKALLFLAVSITVFICLMIMADRHSPVLAFSWVFSLILLLAGFMNDLRQPHKKPVSYQRFAAVFLIILLPIVVRVLLYQPDRIHGDDLLTATFSQNYHPLTTNFFSGIPEGTEWVAKFPTPYFLFQKIFLRITGASVLTVKLSVIPYIAVVSVMTYLIGSLLLGSVAGAVAVFIYAFMAISIYHETLGLHFISSTAIYMVFFYTILRAQKDAKTFWYAASGITCGLCYLSYTSSYIALPVLGLAILGNRITKKPYSKWLAWAVIGATITLAPYVVYAVTRDNYFGGRINQVSLLTGSWSAFRPNAFSPVEIGTILGNNISVSLSSFIENGIGGHGGYTFNKQAFFHKTGFILFLAGLLYALAKKRNISMLLAMLTVFLTYITGVVLTIPPPAYHRLTLAFPFIAVISAAPFSLVSISRKQSVAVALLILAVYAGTNIRYTQTAITPEALIEDAAIIKYINTEYPNRHIHVAAFPSFALGKFFPFFLPVTALSVDTNFHKEYLNNPDNNERYLFIITLPSDFRSEFENTYPDGKYIPYSEKYGILVN